MTKPIGTIGVDLTYDELAYLAFRVDGEDAESDLYMKLVTAALTLKNRLSESPQDGESSRTPYFPTSVPVTSGEVETNVQVLNGSPSSLYEEKTPSVRSTEGQEDK